MTREELERRLDEAEKQNLGLLDEIRNLKEKLAEQDKQEIPDFPEFDRGDVVYTMDSCFDVMEGNHGGGKGDKDFTGEDATFYNNFHTGDYAQDLCDKYDSRFAFLFLKELIPIIAEPGDKYIEWG